MYCDLPRPFGVNNNKVILKRYLWYALEWIDTSRLTEQLRNSIKLLDLNYLVELCSLPHRTIGQLSSTGTKIEEYIAIRVG